MNLDNIEFDIKIIDDYLYYKISETNKDDEKCDNIRETIINDKKKLRNITSNKCVIINEILYHKIAYKYLNRYIRLLFKKYTINLYMIILKLHAYTNYIHEYTIKKCKNHDNYIR